VRLSHLVEGEKNDHPFIIHQVLIPLKTQKEIDQTISLHHSFSLSTQITFPPLSFFPVPLPLLNYVNYSFFSKEKEVC